jgi:hypothetical protein
VTSNLSVPYCTVKGFRRCIAVLADGELPSVIDRDTLVEKGLSPHSAYPVLGAFRFLGLVDDDGSATPALRPFLDESDVAGRRAIVEVAFARLLEDIDFPIEDREEVDELLVERHGCAPGVVAFCSTFFLWIAAESGIPVARLSHSRRGRPPAHLAKLSPAAKACLLELERQSVAVESTEPAAEPIQAPASARQVPRAH